MTPYAAAVRSCMTPGFAPTATQVVADSHATDRSGPKPPIAVRGDHVTPPSVLTTMDEPTATQNVDVGQSTDPSAPSDPDPAGTAHVAPPSDDVRS